MMKTNINKQLNMEAFTIEGNIILPAERKVIKGIVAVHQGRIVSVTPTATTSKQYILPGLVDAHIHIESSMLTPSEFARAAVVHGTTATVSDPHEIANVLGMEGVEFMIRNGAQVPFRFSFGAPSCVPATPLETSGAILDDQDILTLLKKPEIRYLAEMMNFPGVLYGDPQVMAKLEHARHLGKPVDGHAPGLSGEALSTYINAGITTDHECFTLEEAREKASMGMKILIREGSAARNFDDLIPLIIEFPDQVMFCSDDKHPDDLMKGHINLLIQRGLSMGYDLMDLVIACTLNPVHHYRLDCGLLRPGDPADFIIVDGMDSFNVKATYINGIKVAENGKTLIDPVPVDTLNRFNAESFPAEALKMGASHGRVRVIGAMNGQLVTNELDRELPLKEGHLDVDPGQDILKIVVLNRYQSAVPAVGFIHGFGIRSGAIASTVAHDSHNIIAVGTEDSMIKKAMDLLIESKGGLAAVERENAHLLKLPVAGIMSDKDILHVSSDYQKIDMIAKQMGSTLSAPFMTLSFMALLVIPSLKLGDKGLFDGTNFKYTEIFL